MHENKINLQLFADESDEPEMNEHIESDQHDETNNVNAEQETQKPKYTDKDLDDIIGKKFAAWQKRQEKAVNEAKKLAEMNAQQKAEYERDQLQKELDELRTKSAISEMSKTARKMLSDNNISISDELLSALVSDDAEKTSAAVSGFADAFNAAVESAVKDRLRGELPKKGTSGGGSMTKEQIMGIKDPELRQKAILDNKQLFNF